jgi:hypothetical protein
MNGNNLCKAICVEFPITTLCYIPPLYSRKTLQMALIEVKKLFLANN